ESDGKDAGSIVESALDDAGLALEMPSKAAPGEEWLKDSANLRAVLEGVGLEDMVFEERKYPQLLVAPDYLGYQLWGGRGRYLRSVTDETTWDAFRTAALAELERRFPDGIRSVSTTRLAVGTKSA